MEQTFHDVENDCPPDVHAKALEQLLMESLNTFCPLKSFKVGPQAKAWINSELKTLSRRKQRQWLKNGKSKKYDDLLNQFSTKYNAAAEKCMERKKTYLDFPRMFWLKFLLSFKS